MVNCNVLTFLLIIVYLHHAAGEVYYIIPNSNSSANCTTPCLTLSQFAATSGLYLKANTTLVFVQGQHYLNSRLTISSGTCFSMTTAGAESSVTCADNSQMVFNDYDVITITNLDFIECGDNRVQNVKKFMLHGSGFNGARDSGTALELISASVFVFSSTFVSNRKGKLKNVRYPWDEFENDLVGGAIIVTQSKIEILQSYFENNGAKVGGAIFAEQQSTVNITNSTFRQQSVSGGAGVLFADESNVSIDRSVFINNEATYGGAVMYSQRSNINISESQFEHNFVNSRGGVFVFRQCNITIESSNFTSNQLTTSIASSSEAGVMFTDTCMLTIKGSRFSENSALWAGVLESYYSFITMTGNIFDGNTAGWAGGITKISDSRAEIKANYFSNNVAYNRGGALYFAGSNITLETSQFRSNVALNWGGAIDSRDSYIIIKMSTFDNNTSQNLGGALDFYNDTVTLIDDTFTNNNAPTGSVVYASYNSSIYQCNSLLVFNNSAESYGTVYLIDSHFNQHHSGNATLSYNVGSLMLFNSNITISGYLKSSWNNQPLQNGKAHYQEGGAITLFQSNAFFDGSLHLEHNCADNGGAIFSIGSKLYVNGNVTIAHNFALTNGGGCFLSNSELNCQRTSMFLLLFNTASSKGGGLHADSSSIKTTYATVSPFNATYIGTRLNFTQNLAKMGGGLSIEANARLYSMKHNYVYSRPLDDTNTTIFVNNCADYGGAVFVDDYTNTGTCSTLPAPDCFFQVLAIYDYSDERITIQSLSFLNNTAYISGSTLYGGLLDRCAVSQFAEVRKKHSPGQPDSYSGNGITYFKDVSNTTNATISSQPVQVCLCNSELSEHDCTRINIGHEEVKKGELFTLSLVAVDQVGHPVNATIQTSLAFTASGLGVGQLMRNISSTCTNLTFNVYSPHSSEELELYASDGPCKDANLSKRTVEIKFLPCNCPIGFEILGEHERNCTCVCNKAISEYVKKCDSNTENIVKEPQSSVWISYMSSTKATGYLIYSHCPFDYCNVFSPPIDLNKADGADAQCAFNRSSLLCGSCQRELSLSLGTSHCLSCPSYWPALLVSITLAGVLVGIALVAILLIINMTVAVGTLNGLIFYANIVNANKSILLPFQKPNFATVFVSWLNLELGIETCYFPGMDAYSKTWLQLVFPAYVICLVIIIIVWSAYSTKLSNLLGKKNPVATLATLILLSYSKLLDVGFKSLSVGILNYPDNSTEMLWLPDATVKYLSGKHIPLFIAAVIILLAGMTYTALLFSWQWLLQITEHKLAFRRPLFQKLHLFMETYHTPYSPRQRYWPGLLLLIRAVLYLAAAINFTNDPHIALVAVNFTMCVLVVLKAFIGSRSKVHKEWPVDVLESFFFLQLLLFVTFSWFSLSNDINREALAYTFVSVAFLILVGILFFHAYRYTAMFSKVKDTKYFKVFYAKIKEANENNDDDFLTALDSPLNTTHHSRVPLLANEQHPTYSSAEVHGPHVHPVGPQQNYYTRETY